MQPVKPRLAGCSLVWQQRLIIDLMCVLQKKMEELQMQLPLEGAGTDMESARAFFMAADRQPHAQSNGNANGHSGTSSSAGQGVQMSPLPGQRSQDQSQV